MLDYIRELRAHVGHAKILVPGVRTLVLDDRGHLLLEYQPAFGSWALPHGRVDLGESALQAAIRETRAQPGEALRADVHPIVGEVSGSLGRIAHGGD